MDDKKNQNFQCKEGEEKQALDTVFSVSNVKTGQNFETKKTFDLKNIIMSKFCYTCRSKSPSYK